MRLFQRLEYSTEQLWLDFSKQYSSIDSADMQKANKDAIQSLKEKYLCEQEPSQEAQEVEEQPKSIWQRIWNAIMDNLELRPQLESPDDSDNIYEPSEDEDEVDDGLNLSKRERKFLRKQKQYSDVL